MTQSLRLMLLLLAAACRPFVKASSTNWKNLPNAAVTQTRRILNLSGTFGSATHALPYDRIAGHPVFAVTTPWGSPYMNMEKLNDLDETVQTTSSSKKAQSLSEEQNEIRMVALYFLDPADALAVHGEMKQMENLEKTDIRITSFSLAKALRQASNLGNGLLTGMPPDPLTGNIPTDDGGTLRYKIVPPKRQLYYAARCVGKERVGLFAESPAEDAAAAVTGNSALEAANLSRRRDKRERKVQRSASSRTPTELANLHMEGYSGIPVFYCPGMHKKRNIIKRILTGVSTETPLFFNYQDCLSAYHKMKHRPQTDTEPVIEVFNLWDVVTSMDKQQQQHGNNFLSRLQRRWLSRKQNDDSNLDRLIFVANSDAVKYKNAISRRGNGKARLRPMRAW